MPISGAHCKTINNSLPRSTQGVSCRQPGLYLWSKTWTSLAIEIDLSISMKSHGWYTRFVAGAGVFGAPLVNEVVVVVEVEAVEVFVVGLEGSAKPIGVK